METTSAAAQPCCWRPACCYDTKTVTVYQIQAEREITTTYSDGSVHVLAERGDLGGYIQVNTDPEELRKQYEEYGYVYGDVEPGHDGQELEDGRLRGLSQNGDSWVHPNTVVGGDVSVRDDAQVQGYDVQLLGDDVVKDNAAVSGVGTRSYGSNVYEGNAVAVDVNTEYGSSYVLSGDTQMNNTQLNAGDGVFRNDPETGRYTVVAGSRDGTTVTITGDGLDMAGTTVLDDSNVEGHVVAGPGVILQNADARGNLDLQGTMTMVNQALIVEAQDGAEGPTVVNGDAELDAAASVREGYAEREGTTGADQAEYLTEANKLRIHETVENTVYASAQGAEDTISGKMNQEMLQDMRNSTAESQAKGLEGRQARDEFTQYGDDSNEYLTQEGDSSVAQDAKNDGLVDMQRKIDEQYGADALSEFRGEVDGVAAAGEFADWKVGHGDRADALSNNELTSGQSQYVLKDEADLNFELNDMDKALGDLAGVESKIQDGIHGPIPEDGPGGAMIRDPSEVMDDMSVADDAVIAGDAEVSEGSEVKGVEDDWMAALDDFEIPEDLAELDPESLGLTDEQWAQAGVDAEVLASGDPEAIKKAQIDRLVAGFREQANDGMSREAEAASKTAAPAGRPSPDRQSRKEGAILSRRALPGDPVGTDRDKGNDGPEP